MLFLITTHIYIYIYLKQTISLTTILHLLYMQGTPFEYSHTTLLGMHGGTFRKKKKKKTEIGKALKLSKSKMHDLSFVMLRVDCRLLEALFYMSLWFLRLNSEQLGWVSPGPFKSCVP